MKDKEFFEKLESVMMIESHKVWAVITPNEIKKEKIFDFIKKRWHLRVAHELKNELQLKDGTCIRWIHPDNIYRGGRFRWMFIDKECIDYKQYETLYRQVITPSNFKGSRVFYF